VSSEDFNLFGFNSPPIVAKKEIKKNENRFPVRLQRGSSLTLRVNIHIVHLTLTKTNNNGHSSSGIDTHIRFAIWNPKTRNFIQQLSLKAIAKWENLT